MGMIRTDDRREYRRIKFDVPVAIYSNYMLYNSHMQDISLGGGLISKPDRWIESNTNPFEILISSTRYDNQIQMKASVRHSNEKSLGFFCEYIDVDSYARLQKLIENNPGYNPPLTQ